MPHYRVVNAHHPNATWTVWGARGRCPKTGAEGKWGNRFTVSSTGRGLAILTFIEWLRAHPDGKVLAERASIELVGEVLGCWCAPRPCHCDVYAMLADGIHIDAIREIVREWLGIVSANDE